MFLRGFYLLRGSYLISYVFERILSSETIARYFKSCEIDFVPTFCKTTFPFQLERNLCKGWWIIIDDAPFCICVSIETRTSGDVGTLWHMITVATRSRVLFSNLIRSNYFGSRHTFGSEHCQHTYLCPYTNITFFYIVCLFVVCRVTHWEIIKHRKNCECCPVSQLIVR